jgi:hypothetical protein
MLYAQSCITGSGLTVRLTSHSTISGVSIRGWLAAVPRCFSFEMAHTSKKSCSSIRFETESNGSREDHSLLFLCVTQGPTVVPCFFERFCCYSLFVLSPYVSLNFHVQGGLSSVVCRLLSIDWRAVSRNCLWQKREYVCAVLIHFGKLYLSKEVNCEQYNGVWFCREGTRTSE